MRSLLVLVAVWLMGCADEPTASTAPTVPVKPRIIGNVKSISSGDRQTIVDLERAAILKEFHALPTWMTVRVINHNSVMVLFEVRGQQCGDPVDRVRGKWKRPDGPRVTIVGLTNRSSQPLAGVLSTFDFMKQFKEFTTLAPDSGG